MSGMKLWTRRLFATLPAMALGVLLHAQQPVILSVDKLSAGPGETVTLQGNGFGANAASNAVYFGSARGTINFASDQLVEAIVPPGATFGEITLSNTASGRTGYSSANFLYSFGGQPGFTAANLEGQVDFDSERGLYDVCLCDFDRDGKNDMVTANDNSNLITLLANTTSAPGLGNISFNRIPILLNARSLHVTCGDLNGDGRKDFVVSEGGTIGDRIFIYQNTGTGAGDFSFSAQAIRLTGKKVKRVAIADLDLDGRPEIAVTNQSGNDITILVNQSTTAAVSFSATQVTIPVPGAASTDGLTIDDLNGDLLPELVTSQFLTATSNIFVLRNNSTTGNISFSETITIPADRTVVNIAAGDLDHDGKPDLVATRLLAGAISIFRNESTGTALFFASAVELTTADRPWGLDLGDLDGDGSIDITVASLTSKDLTLLNNKSTPGNISFQNIGKATTYINRHVSTGDIDGDGKPDVVFTSIDDNNNGVLASKVSVYRNTVCLDPLLAPEGPHNICAGFSLQLSTTQSAGTTYEWKDGGTVVATGSDAFFDVTISGDYTVTAIAEGGACAITSAPVTVTVGAGTTTGTAAPVNNGPICLGSTMNLSVNDVGGTEYRWTGPEGYTGTGLSPAPVNNFQEAHAGRYHVDVIVNGCVAQQASTVVEAIAVPDFTIGTTGPEIVCAPATMTLTVTPNPGNYTFQWYETSSGVLAGETSTALEVTQNGSYYVEASYTPNPACAVVETTPVDITFAVAPVAGFNAPATACAGQLVAFENTSTADASLTPAYDWDFGDATGATEASPEHSYGAAATYAVRLTVSYENGACADDVTQNIAVQSAPSLTITNPDNIYALCDGDTLALEVPDSFETYLWSTGATASAVEVTGGGTYEVEVTTDDGCTINASREVSLLPSPDVAATADPAEVPEGEQSQLLATGADTYVWEPVEGLSVATIPNPVATPLLTTEYVVTGTGANGCADTARVTVVVVGGSIYTKLTPEKIFSPHNGDGIGDTWIVGGITSFPDCQVTIYDLKGIKVYEAQPYQNDWDGTYNGKALPDGVYYFMIRCPGDENRPRTGSITMLR